MFVIKRVPVCKENDEISPFIQCLSWYDIRCVIWWIVRTSSHIWTSMMVANGLVPIWFQGISNHHINLQSEMLLMGSVMIVSWIKISLKFVPNGSIDNKPVLVQVMAWHRAGDKPLPELMLTQFTAAYMQHYRGRWVNNLWASDTIWWHWSGSTFSLLPDGTKPLPEPVLPHHQWGSVACTWEQFYRGCSRIQSITWVPKSHFYKLVPRTPGYNELTRVPEFA